MAIGIGWYHGLWTRRPVCDLFDQPTIAIFRPGRGAGAIIIKAASVRVQRRLARGKRRSHGVGGEHHGLAGAAPGLAFTRRATQRLGERQLGIGGDGIEDCGHRAHSR